MNQFSTAPPTSQVCTVTPLMARGTNRRFSIFESPTA
jgi:hypothetical protein